MRLVIFHRHFQFDQSSRRVKRDKTTGRGGRAFHGDPRSFVVERTEAQQRGHSARHRSHARNAHVRFRIRGKSKKKTKKNESFFFIPNLT